MEKYARDLAANAKDQSQFLSYGWYIRKGGVDTCSSRRN